MLRDLHAAIGSGLICVNAPAGYGKTTLLAEFTTDIEYNVAWVTLDTTCASIETLTDRFTAALRGGEDGRSDFVPSGNPSDYKAHLSRLVTHASESSWNPLLIVIDNGHEVRDADDALDLIGWLIECAPEGVEIILSGRSLMPVREVDRRVAGGECTVIGPQDLAFDLNEVAAMLDSRNDLSAEALLAETDGWPIGVAALVRGNVALTTPRRAGANAVWERYVVNELWDAVPDRLRPTFRMLSVAERFDRDLAEAIAGPEAAAEFFDWTAQHDFHLTIDADETVRVNPLVRRLVSARFRREEPEAFEATAGRVVDWHVRQHRVLDALQFARAVSPERLLPELLSTCALEIFHQGRFLALDEALGAVPERQRRERPVLGALYARTAAHLGKPHEALTRAEAVLALPDLELEDRIHAQLARVKALRLVGRTDELDRLLAQLQTIPLDKEAEPLLAAEVAYADAERNVFTDSDGLHAERRLRESADLAARGGARTLERLARSTLGVALLARGDGPAAVTVLLDAARLWRQGSGSANLGWVLNNLGMAHLLVGDNESAATVLAEAREEAIACENVRNKAYATASMGDAYLAAGDYDRARVAYEEAIALCATDVADECLSAFSIAGLAAAFLGLGNLKEADYFIRRATLIADVAGSAYEQGHCRLHESAIRLACGEPMEAINLAREAVALLTEANAQSGVRMAHYRLAQCLFRAGRRAPATEALDRLHEVANEAWMVRALEQAIHEDPMFAQWAAARDGAPIAFRQTVESTAFKVAGLGEEKSVTLPVVSARSLGTVEVLMDGESIPDQAWASVRAKELFFLFLSQRTGLRKEEAVEQLYPEIEREKCNSAFHTNLHRVRKALYHDCIVKQDGAYRLNPAGAFEWDVDAFRTAMEEAQQRPPGSDERATALREALELYNGPFAEAFYSEWADSLRSRLDNHAQSSLATLAGYYAGREEYEEAISCVEQIFDRDRLNEEAAYQLAKFRAKAGQPALALRFVDEYRQTYAEEFGGPLPSRFSELRAKIAAGVAV